jgi:hypothetical protein
MSEDRLPSHPYAELFPLMQHPDFDALCGHIAANGLQEEIVLYEGQILDGRNRYLACLARGVAPRFRDYAGECGSPLAFVIARNVRRRHLTESQRALLAARLKPLFEEEARQRQLAGLKHVGPSIVGANLRQREEPEENRKSADKAAQSLQVSARSVLFANRVNKQGVPTLIERVATGKIAVSAAAQIAKLPPEQQQEAVAGIERGLKPKQALAQVKANQAEPALWVDDDGLPLPEQAVPAFHARKDLRALVRHLEADARALERLAASALGVYLDAPAVQEHLKHAVQKILAAEPAHVCPACRGQQPACTLCGGQGWLTEPAYRNATTSESAA